MELVAKLLPILIFSAISILAVAHGRVWRELEQQLLPDIPGYVPVYIQHGDVPPDVEAMYKAAQLKSLSAAAAPPPPEDLESTQTDRPNYEDALPPEQPRPTEANPEENPENS